MYPPVVGFTMHLPHTTGNVKAGASPSQTRGQLGHAAPDLRVHHLPGHRVCHGAGAAPEGHGQLPGGGPDRPAGPLEQGPGQTQEIPGRADPETHQQTR